MVSMKRSSDPLHLAPDKAETALLIIDVINDLGFEAGDQLLKFALPMATALAKLKRRANAAGIPVIYVNDNFGRWRSDFPTLVHLFSRPNVRGQPVVIRLKPKKHDYFVLK